MSSSNLDLQRISFQSQLRSKPIINNFIDIENNYNSLRAEVYASIASTASEVTSARDNFSSLTDNIHIRRVLGDGIATGGLIYSQATPDNTVRVTAGEALINGVGIDWAAGTSGTISAVSKARKNVVVINTDNTVSVVLGSTSATAPDYFLPDIATTQRPLALLSQSTASPPVFNSTSIDDAREQGCWIPTKNKWFFKIQDAIDYLGDTGGTIEVGPGNYYENITYGSNQRITYSPNASLYTPNGTAVDFSNIALPKNNTYIKYKTYDINQYFCQYINSTASGELKSVATYQNTNSNGAATYVEILRVQYNTNGFTRITWGAAISGGSGHTGNIQLRKNLSTVLDTVLITQSGAPGGSTLYYSNTYDITFVSGDTISIYAQIVSGVGTSTILNPRTTFGHYINYTNQANLDEIL